MEANVYIIRGKFRKESSVDVPLMRFLPFRISRIVTAVHPEPILQVRPTGYISLLFPFLREEHPNNFSAHFYFYSLYHHPQINPWRTSMLFQMDYL